MQSPATNADVAKAEEPGESNRKGRAEGDSGRPGGGNVARWSRASRPRRRWRM